MSAIFNLAIKDLRLLFRDKLAAFFVFGFPILMGLFFGSVMNTGAGSGDSASKITLLIVDQDQSDPSRELAQLLGANENLLVQTCSLNDARQQVLKGSHPAYLLVPKTFGDRAGRFWQQQAEIELGTDPSRSAEAAMIEGFVMQAMGQIITQTLTDTSQMTRMIDRSRLETAQDATLPDDERKNLMQVYDNFSLLIKAVAVAQSVTSQSPVADTGQTKVVPPADQTVEMPAAKTSTATMNFANIKRVEVTAALLAQPAAPERASDSHVASMDAASPVATVKVLPRSGWDLSFPQGMLWGVLGCVAGFAISIAKERSQGTMVRLQASPLTINDILLGKALACFLAVLGVIAMMVLLGTCLGMRATSYFLLVVSALCIAIGFSGIMMTMSTLGKTEQSVSGSGWAINMLMAMFGGAMIPLLFMPQIFQQISLLSPVRWAIYTLEGSIWRGLSVTDLWPAWAILLSIGAMGLAIGSAQLRRSL